MRAPDHRVSLSERPRYVLVNSEQPEFAGSRNQVPVHKDKGHQSVSMHEPAELRFDKVLPSIEGSPRTHLAIQASEQRELKYPALDVRAPESPSDRTFRVVDFDQGREIQLMKRRKIDDQGVYSPPWGPGRSLPNTLHDRVLIPIGQSEAPRPEESLARLTGDNPRTVSYMQQPAFLQPLTEANGSGQHPSLKSSRQTRHEPVIKIRLDRPCGFQSPPPHVHFRRSLAEAEGPLQRPSSHSFFDHAPAHSFHESSQSAVSHTRKLDSSHYGAFTPYVSSGRYEIPPLDSLNHEISEEPARREYRVMEREYDRQVHEGSTGTADLQGQHNIYDEPQLEERGQIVYIPVQQDQSTSRILHRRTTQLPLEMSYQGLQTMVEVSQPRYEETLRPAEEGYGRVTHPTRAVQLESRSYPRYNDDCVEVIHSAAPRAEEKRARLQGAPLGGQRYAMALECIWFMQSRRPVREANSSDAEWTCHG